MLCQRYKLYSRMIILARSLRWISSKYYNRLQKQQQAQVQPKQEQHRPKHDPMKCRRAPHAISRARENESNALRDTVEWRRVDCSDRFTAFISFFIVEWRLVDSADRFTSRSTSERTEGRMCTSLPFRLLLVSTVRLKRKRYHNWYNKIPLYGVCIYEWC